MTDDSPLAFGITDPAPNPFNPTTSFSFTLHGDCRVNLTVHDILGREVAVIEDSLLQAGHHRRTWNGCDRSGKPAASGIYIWRFSTAGFTRSGKMPLMR